MCSNLIALTLITIASGNLEDQALKSGPQTDETLPGSFQPLNINGPFAGRHHCLVTEFRLNPVVAVFVRAQPEGVDAEVRKLLEALEKAAQNKHSDSGLETFVVFLTPQARSSATDDAKGNADQAKALVDETVQREKLVNNLKECSSAFKRLVVTCSPVESIAQQYRLADRAEVTVVIYARHRVYFNFAFAEGQLNQDGVDRVLNGVETMLGRLTKG
jgi:hypothetical protein